MNDLDRLKSEFEELKRFVRTTINFYTRIHYPRYSMALLAKTIGVSSKTVQFGGENSENMSHRKWIELAEGLIKLKEGVKNNG